MVKSNEQIVSNDKKNNFRLPHSLCKVTTNYNKKKLRKKKEEGRKKEVKRKLSNLQLDKIEWKDNKPQDIINTSLLPSFLTQSSLNLHSNSLLSPQFSFHPFAPYTYTHLSTLTNTVSKTGDKEGIKTMSNIIHFKLLINTCEPPPWITHYIVT